eukprot:CAMPEP_0202449770 /NCGR_PEP_ID=MMETSP1360-20130828/8475_1 /ASSEMBLY_ACC=CAM_ASM_000848 /TAXON_ID=515479 /ORGANISM="Licmophora paradoxa, Strain CCMP2313" /LENGTH=93 /DNA_ID=CAMNT_0049067805 /DNA_START=261 /DNA_END=539 /DNA_ORIENTATION=-
MSRTRVVHHRTGHPTKPTIPRDQPLSGRHIEQGIVGVGTGIVGNRNTWECLFKKGGNKFKVFVVSVGSFLNGPSDIGSNYGDFINESVVIASW